MRKDRLGQLIVIAGSMFAGKSEELIRLARRNTYARRKIQVFKHAWDDRFEKTAVAAHSGMKIEGEPVRNSAEIAARLEPDTEVIAIEEAQFFDEGLPAMAVRWADEGRTVILAGLDQDFRREPFGIMPQLMAVADEVVKLRAICMVCGQSASHTQRLVDGKPAAWNEPTVLIGAEDHYEARCRRCHRIKKPK